MDDLRPQFLEETAATVSAAARTLASGKATRPALDEIAAAMLAIRDDAGTHALPRIGAVAAAVGEAIAVAADHDSDPGLIQALRAGCQRIAVLVRGAARTEPKGSDHDILMGLAAMAGAVQRLERARLFAGRTIRPLATAGDDRPAGDENRSWLLADALQHLDAFARDLAADASKRIRFSLATGTVRATERVLTALMPTLIQLVRNAVGHGLESLPERLAAGKDHVGQVSVSAHRQGRRVAIEVADDGRGIDPRRIAAHAAAGGAMPSADPAALSDEARLRLVFAPGFSTARRRGTGARGYGLDAAAKRVAALGGTISVRSAPGEGTIFTILLPDAPARPRGRRPAGKATAVATAPVAAIPAQNWS